MFEETNTQKIVNGLVNVDCPWLQVTREKDKFVVTGFDLVNTTWYGVHGVKLELLLREDIIRILDHKGRETLFNLLRPGSETDRLIFTKGFVEDDDQGRAFMRYETVEVGHDIFEEDGEAQAIRECEEGIALSENDFEEDSDFQLRYGRGN